MIEISRDEANVPDRIGVDAPGLPNADEAIAPVVEVPAGVSAIHSVDALQDPMAAEAFGALSEEKEAETIESGVADAGTNLLDEEVAQNDEPAGSVDNARSKVVAAFEQPADTPALDGSGTGGIDRIIPPTGGDTDDDGNDNSADNGEGVTNEGSTSQVSQRNLGAAPDNPNQYVSSSDGDITEEEIDGVHGGQERQGVVVESGKPQEAQIESEGNRTFHELSPSEQLDRFHERAAASQRATYNSTWIRDESRGVEVYIRDGSRPVRRVVDMMGEVKVGGINFALQGRCLEISDIKRVGNDPTSINHETAPELFLQVMGVLAGYAERAGIWDAVSIENLGDPVVSEWCTDNGWKEDPTVPEELDSWLRPDFLYKPLPGRGVVGI